MTEKDFFDIDFKEEKLDVKSLVGRYLNYWPVILVSIVLCFCSAFIVLKFKSTLFEATSRIQILDNKETPNFSLDLKGLLGKSKVNLDNEVAVLKSYRIVEQVVKELDLNVSYFAKKRLVKRQIFNAPFNIKHILKLDSIKESIVVDVKINSTGYLLIDKENDLEYQVNGYYYNGENEKFPIIIKDLRKKNTDYSQLTYTVIVQNLASATKRNIKSIRIAPAGKDSELLNLSIQTQGAIYSKKIINTLIDVYIKDGIKDRQKVYKRTIEFVDNRFKFLITELNNIEKNKKNFKQENKMSFLNADTELTIVRNSETEKELLNLETQIELTNMLKETISNKGNKELLPVNIGVDNNIINDQIKSYNLKLIEFKRLELNTGRNNPFLQQLEQDIFELNNSISLTIREYILQLRLTYKKAKKIKDSTQNQFKKIPEKEQALRDIERQQNLKESLYLLLLQKREESAINQAVTVSNVKVIDYAIVSGPITPSKIKIYVLSIFLGILIPVLFLYVIFLLDTKIHSSKDIESITKEIPILSRVPFLKEASENLTVDESDRSILKESFRTLLTNLNFIIKKTDSGLGQTLLVTSSIKGEGKTLVSYNLAVEAANHSGKVLIIGADLRNPQLHRYLSLSNISRGLSSYLHDTDLKSSELEILNSTVVPNLDILLAGSIPPNPTSLLSNGRFEQLISELKQKYDFIVIDSAPTLLVSDTFIFGKLADVTVYVTRANYTEKQVIEYTKKLHDDDKLNNMAYVLNGVDTSTYGYGYKYEYAYTYGYTYDDDNDKKRKWFNFRRK